MDSTQTGGNVHWCRWPHRFGISTSLGSKSLVCSMSFSSHLQGPDVSQLSLAQFKPEPFTWLRDVWSVLTCVYVDDVRVQSSPALCCGLSCDLLKMPRFSLLLALAQNGYKMIGVFTFHLHLPVHHFQCLLKTGSENAYSQQGMHLKCNASILVLCSRGEKKNHLKQVWLLTF